jgi:hypothetical protein
MEPVFGEALAELLGFPNYLNKTLYQVSVQRERLAILSD